MNASKFKEQRLAVLDGKPVARLIPADSACQDLIGSMKDKIQIHGDILSTGIEWDAES